MADFLPVFLVSIMMNIAHFCTTWLGITLKPLALKKDQFGAACVTSLGGFGFHDATAPFTRNKYFKHSIYELFCTGLE
jgi:hypothetical protein